MKKENNTPTGHWMEAKGEHRTIEKVISHLRGACLQLNQLKSNKLEIRILERAWYHYNGAYMEYCAVHKINTCGIVQEEVKVELQKLMTAHTERDYPKYKIKNLNGLWPLLKKDILANLKNKN